MLIAGQVAMIEYSLVYTMAYAVWAHMLLSASGTAPLSLCSALGHGDKDRYRAADFSVRLAKVGRNVMSF